MAARDLSAALVGALVLLGRLAAAGPLSPSEVPEPLRPWTDWVLRGHETERCPFLVSAPQDTRCVWPSRLRLDLDDRGGSFRQAFLVVHRALVTLPGDGRRWPQGVQVDGRPTALLERDGSPAVELADGRHEVTGEFIWDALPELLPVPGATGLISLRLRGQEILAPSRDPRSQLWLGRRAVDRSEESRLDVAVHRRVTDDVPLLLTTQLKLLVAGENREVLLARALPDGFAPMSLESALPARLEPDGRLRLQVRPGTWYVTLAARHQGPATELRLPEVDGPWDAEEIWVFEARNELRLVTIEGVEPIDPQQTELPDDWRELPAYPMKAGSVLRLIERRRGDADPAADQLSLSRTLWLDFDGGGFTIRDDLGGTMARSWRLEMQAPIELGRVAVGGRDQFITRLGAAGLPGVEVREGSLRAEADARLGGGARELPAVGWNHDFQRVSTVLNLPPGWKLFHATGADEVSETWVERWTLLDLFVVLVLTFAIAAVWGRAWGAIALVTLALIYPEHGVSAPTWIAVVALEALARALPQGRALAAVRAARLAATIVLVLSSVVFMIEQARTGLFPALEQPGMAARRRGVVWEGTQRPPLTAPLERLTDEAGELAQEEEIAGRGRRRVPLAKHSLLESDRVQDRMAAIDPNARITTGPGVPRWTWRTVAFSWRGPVHRQHTLRFYLLSPGANLVLAWLRIALLAVLLYCVLRVRAAVSLPGGTGASAAVIAAVLLFAPSGARADFPPAELLAELRSRLLERPDCLPSCAGSPRLIVDAAPDRLALRVEIDSAADLAVPLPGGERHWVPAHVALDGAPAEGIALGDDGLLWLRVTPGRHQVVLEGPLPEAADTVELPLPLLPRRVEARADGWRVEGLREDGVVEGTISLVRERGPGKEGGETLAPGALPPFVRVERVIRLGLSREVTTRVARLTPAGTAVLLEVPLLSGESPVTPDLRVENGRALVQLAPRATEVVWESILEASPLIELRAGDAGVSTEVWVLDAGPIWHVEAKGLPTIKRDDGGGARLREWRPWPGESVTIEISRPEGVPGPTLTIDRAALAVRPGRRATDATLDVEIRSSRGADHVVTLPEAAELQSVTIDGASQPIRQERRAVALPIHPGTQSVSLAWREARGVTARFRTPDVDLGIPSVNDDVTLEMPADRWILFVGGGRLGPAVLFWSVLAIVVLAALALARLGWTPLGAASWFLLGVGLTQATIVSAGVVVGWLLVLAWRRREGRTLTAARFNLLQILLVVWTIAALATLFGAIERGLLGAPEMQILGNGSHAGSLHWTFDRSDIQMPRAWVISAPLFVYRLAMLAWALWIAASLLRWLRWGWECFGEGGLWRKDGLRPRFRGPRPAPPVG